MPGGAAPGPTRSRRPIAALHDEAPTARDTDWPQIALLYGELARVAPGPVVELNRAVAVAMAQGPAQGLALLDELGDTTTLVANHLFHSARAPTCWRVSAAPTTPTRPTGGRSSW